MKPLLCVTVTAPTMAELRRRRDAIADADLVELRLDTVSDPDPAGALDGRRMPVIVTCRPQWEGGQFGGSEEERQRILEAALAHGAEFVDVEWRAAFHDAIVRAGGRRVVLSSHDFDMVPIDLVARLHAMRGTGAGVVKLAMKLTTLSDCVALKALGAASDGSSDVVIVGMGEFGLPTRVLAGRFGSRWTYAGALREIGQVQASTLLDEYRLRSIGEATALYGLVGRPVAHSVSPSMHNAAFDAAQLDAVYLPLPASDVDDFMTFARAFGLRGASVTVPYKVALFERVDEAYSVARRVGAVNTIRVDDDRGDRWIGENTDANAFLRPLQDREGAAHGRASILGAGGAARAVAVALASTGARVTIHARNREQAEKAALATAAAVGAWPPVADTWDLLVNCTPIGMHPAIDESPMPAARLTGGCVYDLIYNPPTTRLLRDAERMGCRVINGLEMLVAQAQEQFHWWTGRRPPAGVMREAALRRLAEFAHDENYVV